MRDALGDLFDAVSVVWFDLTNPADRLVWVYWSPEDPRRPATANENTVTVWITPTSTREANAIGDVLRDGVLPQVADWLHDAFGRDDSWQALSHARWWNILDGEIIAESHDESPKRLKSR